jgi:hypothetical protein
MTENKNSFLKSKCYRQLQGSYSPLWGVRVSGDVFVKAIIPAQGVLN